MGVLTTLTVAISALTTLGLAQPVRPSPTTQPPRQPISPQIVKPDTSEQANSKFPQIQDRLDMQHLNSLMELEHDGNAVSNAYRGCDLSATSLDNDQIWAYAKAWHDLIDINFKRSPSKDILVAVIYVPGKGICFGSNPTTSAAHEDTFSPILQAEIRQNAPELWEILQERQTNLKENNQKADDHKSKNNNMASTATRMIHAEDFAYVVSKKGLNIASRRFPGGTTGAVWGFIHPTKPSGPQKNWGSGSNRSAARINPSCSETQMRLGVPWLDPSSNRLPDSKPAKTDASAGRKSGMPKNPEKAEPSTGSRSGPFKPKASSSKGQGDQGTVEDDPTPRKPYNDMTPAEAAKQNIEDRQKKKQKQERQHSRWP